MLVVITLVIAVAIAIAWGIGDALPVVMTGLIFLFILGGFGMLRSARAEPEEEIDPDFVGPPMPAVRTRWSVRGHLHRSARFLWTNRGASALSTLLLALAFIIWLLWDGLTDPTIESFVGPVIPLIYKPLYLWWWLDLALSLWMFLWDNLGLIIGVMLLLTILSLFWPRPRSWLRGFGAFIWRHWWLIPLTFFLAIAWVTRPVWMESVTAWATYFWTHVVIGWNLVITTLANIVALASLIGWQTPLGFAIGLLAFCAVAMAISWRAATLVGLFVALFLAWTFPSHARAVVSQNFLGFVTFMLALLIAFAATVFVLDALFRRRTVWTLIGGAIVVGFVYWALILFAPLNTIQRYFGNDWWGWWLERRYELEIVWRQWHPSQPTDSPPSMDQYIGYKRLVDDVFYRVTCQKNVCEPSWFFRIPDPGKEREGPGQPLLGGKKFPMWDCKTSDPESCWGETTLWPRMDVCVTFKGGNVLVKKSRTDTSVIRVEAGDSTPGNTPYRPLYRAEDPDKQSGIEMIFTRSSMCAFNKFSQFQ